MLRLKGGKKPVETKKASTGKRRNNKKTDYNSSQKKESDAVAILRREPSTRRGVTKEGH